MNRSFTPLILFLPCAFCWMAEGQSEPAAQKAPEPTTTIHAKSQEVVLDMVFRDKKGRTLHDIKPEEIHVFEDGVEQKVASFDAVQEQANATAPTAQPATNGGLGLDPMREVRLVTLVFEGLDQEGKRFFRQALKDVLDTAPQQNLYFSIYTIDQKLHCIQPFTADHAALMKAAEKSASWGFIQYQNNSAQMKAELKQTLSGGQPDIQSSPGGGPSPSQIQGLVQYQMAKMQYDMLQAADSADRQYDARATIEALMAVVRAESQLPGRKVVLYFNPWLVIPESVKELYKNLISAANRANVSFYTVDPKGLVAMSDSGNGTDVYSENGAGRGMLSDAATDIRNKQLHGGVGEVTTSEAQATENAEAALRANPLLWLQDLSQQTGGVTIAQTNDTRAPLRVVMDEVRTYYEASYVPTISTYDGSFHKISVRVDRPDVVVHTRSGYFALPPLKGGQQVYAYEMPMLNALNTAQAPHDLAFQAAAERFNDHGAKIEYMVTLEASEKDLTFTPQADHKTASVDAALLAVIKNSSGEIVDKFSKDFAVQVPVADVDAHKQGDLLQTFRTELAPGTYTLEAVVMDRSANKLSAKKSAVTVPESSGKLSMSDVVVVRRTDRLKDNQILNPFYFPGGKVTPTLTDTLKGGPGNILPFYFTVYPDRAIKDAPKLTMAFYKEGQYLGAAEAPLPDAEPDGRIPYIANLPADKFTPGNYEIRIGVVQGTSKVEQNVDFQVD